jgi:hypothetical protein
MNKKVLDITAKDWTKEALEKLRQGVKEQGMKFQVEIKTSDGKTKYMYCRDPDGKDVSGLCNQMDATIVKVSPFD